VPPPSPSDSGGGSAFFTNAILCLKTGGLQAKVDRSWFEQCGRLFLQPTIDLIGPSVVVTLGAETYRATCEAYGNRPLPFRTAVARLGERLPNGSLLVPVYHCGARILNTHRPLETQKNDWLRVRRALNESRSRR
jgi:uracil-DNA glycosylase